MPLTGTHYTVHAQYNIPAKYIYTAIHTKDFIMRFIIKF